MSLSLVWGPFFNRLSLGFAKVVAKLEHFDDQERKGKRNIEQKGQLKKQKEKGRKEQERKLRKKQGQIKQ